jgi:NAD(P)-dependent dehydrogenase (short-subunit alcohol dehydrogenase family)
VTKKDEVQALVDKAVQEFGKLDVIINNWFNVNCPQE